MPKRSGPIAATFATPNPKKDKLPRRKPIKKVWLSYEDFGAFLPLKVDEGTLVAWSRSGSFPKAFRINNKSVPVWSTSILVEWVWAKFGANFPDRCERFEEEILKLKDSIITSPASRRKRSKGK